MPWYHGESVLDHLESVYVGSDRNSSTSDSPCST